MTGTTTAAGGGAGRLAGGLDIMTPIIENTTPPAMNATKSLRPIPHVGRGDAFVSGAVF